MGKQNDKHDRPVRRIDKVKKPKLLAAANADASTFAVRLRKAQ